MPLFRAGENHTEPDPVHRVGKRTQNTGAETVRNITERPGDEIPRAGVRITPPGSVSRLETMDRRPRITDTYHDPVVQPAAPPLPELHLVRAQEVAAPARWNRDLGR